MRDRPGPHARGSARTDAARAAIDARAAIAAIAAAGALLAACGPRRARPTMPPPTPTMPPPTPTPAPEPAPPAAVRAAPLASAPAPAPPPDAACVEPLADAATRLGGAAPGRLELASEPTDLDGDGTPDAIVIEPGAREPAHLLYVTVRRGCARFVGRVDAFMLGCDDAPPHAMCDLWVDTWLMHGDRLRTRWSFDGHAYQPVGDGELVPGPRKGP